MTKTSKIYIGLTILLIGIIYIFVPTKSKHTNYTDEKAAPQKALYSLEQYHTDFKSKQPDSLRIIIDQVESTLAKASDSISKIKAYSELIKMYNGFQSPELSAWYGYQKATLVQHSNSWELCGDNFITILRDPKVDSILSSDLIEKATKSYQNSVTLDSNNIPAKIKLAQCFMELKNEPMQGVQNLLAIVRKDSMNIPANLLLAKFGLISGQYEKVMPRLKKVLSLQPTNIEALLLNADANAQTGHKDIAVTSLNTILMQKNINPQMRADITKAVEELK